MARIARVVLPGFPHHITQRGNLNRVTFLEASDYQTYLDLMREWPVDHGVKVLAYCLLPDHVHLLVVPSTESGLCRAIGETHRRFSRSVNQREGRRGYLWRGRFGSTVLDDSYLRAAIRLVELHPVRNRLVQYAWDYPWSSARSHVEGGNDPFLATGSLVSRVGDWKAFLLEGISEEEILRLRKHDRTGRPLGDAGFLLEVERMTGRILHPRRPGPKGPRARKQEQTVWAPAAELEPPKP